jgi:hypothetical protein
MADGDQGTTLPPEGGRRCRNVVSVAVRALLDLIEESAEDGRVSMDVVRRIGHAVMSAQGPLSSLYTQTQHNCQATFELHAIERKRTDFLGRIVTQPFSELFDDPKSGVERKHLPQLFAAVRMMVGEEVYDDLRAKATDSAEQHRTVEGPVDWESFYADPLTAAVREQVLVTMGRSFRRFEPRKDWFLIVMNSNPSSVSLGSSVFIAKKPEEKAVREFTELNMCRLFKALFASVRPDAFDDSRRRAFTERWGSDPEKIFGVMFVELQALCQQVGA